MRIAIVHDYLPGYAGSERCLEQIIKLYPSADLFALVDFIPDAERGFLLHKPVTTSFLQKIPFIERIFRKLLPLMPLAIEQFDLSAYDLILSSSHAVAKGVIVGPDQVHLSYVYSPMRYAWDLQHQYLRESRLERGPLSWVARAMLHRLRVWDCRTSNGVDQFVAISQFIARRIHKVYRRQAQVIYPPVDIERFTVHRAKEDYYLTASRLVPYKHTELIVRAFNALPERHLIVIGDGPELTRLRQIAKSNVQFLGYQPFETLRHHMQRARAFVFAAEEDFGIVTVEAQACGTPVIAYGKGGATETVVPGVTGVFFDEQTDASLLLALKEFEARERDFDPDVIRSNATRFGMARFADEFRAAVERAIRSSCGSHDWPDGHWSIPVENVRGEFQAVDLCGVEDEPQNSKWR